MIIPHFAIFGLSGVGKTTFVERVCRNHFFTQPCQTVTRAVRTDDNKEKFEYLTPERFQELKKTKQFFLEYCDGHYLYGYQKKALHTPRCLILYGLPALIKKITKLGGICILIIGDAQKGLEIRNDPSHILERRSKGNRFLQNAYYGNPEFLQYIDLVLTNEIGHMKKMIHIFKQFVFFKMASKEALRGNTSALLHVLSIYHFPLQGMRYNSLSHQLYVREAFRHPTLVASFFLHVIRESNITVAYF